MVSLPALTVVSASSPPSAGSAASSPVAGSSASGVVVELSAVSVVPAEPVSVVLSSSLDEEQAHSAKTSASASSSAITFFIANASKKCSGRSAAPFHN
jgi:hypothetical protein